MNKIDLAMVTLASLLSILLGLISETQACTFLNRHAGGAAAYTYASNTSVPAPQFSQRRRLLGKNLQNCVGRPINTQITCTLSNLQKIITRGSSPAIARLSFHDCVQGSCDGCIDLDDPNNNGLKRAVDQLHPAVVRTDLSTADVWAMAMKVALETTKPSNAAKSFGFQYYGRTDCTALADRLEVPMPGPNLVTQELLDFFKSRFPDFTSTDTVALMGLHTLGAMEQGHSGFSGTWVPSENTLNNEYFKYLLEQEWQQTNGGNPQQNWFWMRQGYVFGDLFGRSVMLNSDVALVVDLSATAGYNANSGQATCSVRNGSDSDLPACSNAAATLADVQRFRNDQTAWFEAVDFAVNKMLNTGYSLPTCAPGAFCLLNGGVTPTITTPPTGAGNDGGGGGAAVYCFPGTATVQVQEQGSIEIRNLKLGDRVLVEAGRYEPVYTFGHKLAHVEHTEFLQLQIGSTTELTLTPNHLVFVGARGRAVPAARVEIGTLVQLDGPQRLANVTDVRMVTATGLFAPFTPSGSLVVNGVRASVFSSLQGSEMVELIQGVPSFVTHQWLYRTLMSPLALWCSFSDSRKSGSFTCEEETYVEGMSSWLYYASQLHSGWSQYSCCSIVNVLLSLALILVLAVVTMVNLVVQCSLEELFLYTILFVAAFQALGGFGRQRSGPPMARD